MLCPDVLDSAIGLPPLTAQATVLPLVALFCASFTAAVQFDLKIGQDLLSESWRAQAWATIGAAACLFVAPPCRLYLVLMQTNWPRMGWASRRPVARLGLECLKLAIDACHAAAKAGKFFCFEHPARSRALMLSLVQGLLEYDGAQLIYFDQCCYGLTSRLGAAVRKRTVFLTNHPQIIQEFKDRFCQKQHVHRVCQGYENGVRVSKHCEVYPTQLVLALQSCCNAV